VTLSGKLSERLVRASTISPYVCGELISDTQRGREKEQRETVSS